MNHLLLKQVTKQVADKVLFENVDLGINAGQKFGLIARNGAGKTTLLNIITGRDEPDSGEVVRHPNLRIGFLSQEPEFTPGQRVIETLVEDQDNPLARTVMAYEAAAEAQALANTSANQARLQQAMEAMDRERAWDFEAQVKQVLSKLQIQRLEEQVDKLSGGQRKRLALARVLLQQPDFLILDEPTNHLDLALIEWLETFLQRPNLSMLMVTHDRSFLDSVTEIILELEGTQLRQYKGGYTYYLEKKAEHEHAKQQEVTKARSLVRQELDWVRRSPKARGTKAKARLDAFAERQKTASQRLGQDEVRFEIETSRMGSRIIDLKNVSKSYGDLTLLDGFTYNFKRFEKAGVVGENGTGKTTFLNILTGKVKPDTGTVKVGDTIKISHFRQENPPDFTGKRVIDIVREVAEVIPLKSGHSMGAAQFLEMFQFPREQQWNYYETLSGGERRRLHLVTVLIGAPNFLILDEPTNDLDIATLQVLEQFLHDFPGCVLIVSHDRFFMDKVVDHTFVFEGNGKIIDYPGNYSQYREWKDREEAKQQARASVAKSEEKTRIKPDKPKTRLGYMEKREFEQLTKDIEQLEKRQSELSELLETGETDYTKVQAWSEELEEIRQTLAVKEDRWLELSEYEIK